MSKLSPQRKEVQQVRTSIHRSVVFVLLRNWTRTRNLCTLISKAIRAISVIRVIVQPPIEHLLGSDLLHVLVVNLMITIIIRNEIHFDNGELRTVNCAALGMRDLNLLVPECIRFGVPVKDKLFLLQVAIAIARCRFEIIRDILLYFPFVKTLLINLDFNLISLGNILRRDLESHLAKAVNRSRRERRIFFIIFLVKNIRSVFLLNRLVLLRILGVRHLDLHVNLHDRDVIGAGRGTISLRILCRNRHLAFETLVLISGTRLLVAEVLIACLLTRLCLLDNLTQRICVPFVGYVIPSLARRRLDLCLGILDHVLVLPCVGHVQADVLVIAHADLEHTDLAVRTRRGMAFLFNAETVCPAGVIANFVVAEREKSVLSSRHIT